MPTNVAGPEIERLVQLLARLPGLGPRSARRAALHLIRKRESLLAPLVAVAGGVNARNAADYARAGADILVTSAPYWAPPSDVRVTFLR